MARPRPTKTQAMSSAVGRGHGRFQAAVGRTAPSALTPWCLAVASLAGLCCGCSSPAVGKLASETLSAAAGSLKPGKSNEQYRADRRHCGLWDSVDRRCPVLPACGLSSSDQATRINACSRDGRLRPLAACSGQRPRQRLCPGGEFPSCERLVGEGCLDYDEVVCRGEGQKERLLECCATGRRDCVSNTYSLVEPRVVPEPAPSAEPSSSDPQPKSLESVEPDPEPEASGAARSDP